MPPATSIQIGSSVPSSRRKSNADSWKKLRDGQLPPRNRVSDQTAARPSSADAAVRRAMTMPRTATDRRSGISRRSAMRTRRRCATRRWMRLASRTRDRPPGRRERRRRAGRGRRDAEIVRRDRQHPPRRQPRRRRRRRCRRQTHAARERDPARQRAARAHERASTPRRRRPSGGARTAASAARSRSRSCAPIQARDAAPRRYRPPVRRAWSWCPVPSRPRCDRCSVTVRSRSDMSALRRTPLLNLILTRQRSRLHPRVPGMAPSGKNPRSPASRRAFRDTIASLDGRRRWPAPAAGGASQRCARRARAVPRGARRRRRAAAHRGRADQRGLRARGRTRCPRAWRAWPTSRSTSRSWICPDARAAVGRRAARDPLAAWRELRPVHRSRADRRRRSDARPVRPSRARSPPCCRKPLPEVDALLRAHVKRLAGFRRARTRGLLVLNAYGGIKDELAAAAPELGVALDALVEESEARSDDHRPRRRRAGARPRATQRDDANPDVTVVELPRRRRARHPAGRGAGAGRRARRWWSSTTRRRRSGWRRPSTAARAPTCPARSSSCSGGWRRPRRRAGTGSRWA